MQNRRLTPFDRILSNVDKGLKTLTQGAFATDRHPDTPYVHTDGYNADTQKHVAGLMRINHTGEVCAQALYQGQALTAKSFEVREEMQQAALEEVDHLVWCEERLTELGSRPSLLNPVFYGLSFTLGAATGALSDRISLGFVIATEEQVCKHLEAHLVQIPEFDGKTRAILETMLEDEQQHATAARHSGGINLPPPVTFGMHLMSRVMTKTTYHI